jgi:hypothetical protein
VRLPVSSEADAFRSVFAVAAVLSASLLVGYAIAPAAGVAVVCVFAAALAWMIARKPAPSSLREAEAEAEHRQRSRRVLLVANEAPTPRQLRDAILRRGEARAILEVHAPVLQCRTHFVTTDIDRETEQARRRLRETLNAAQSEGISASGGVGDPIDPLAGVEDELRRGYADEVIVTTHGRSPANWVESELLERLRSELAKPVTQLVIDAQPSTAGDRGAGGDH